MFCAEKSITHTRAFGMMRRLCDAKECAVGVSGARSRDAYDTVHPFLVALRRTTILYTHHIICCDDDEIGAIIKYNNTAGLEAEIYRHREPVAGPRSQQQRGARARAHFARIARAEKWKYTQHTHAGRQADTGVRKKHASHGTINGPTERRGRSACMA